MRDAAHTPPSVGPPNTTHSKPSPARTLAVTSPEYPARSRRRVAERLPAPCGSTSGGQETFIEDERCASFFPRLTTWTVVVSLAVLLLVSGRRLDCGD